jgi:hypothetical protein
MRLRLKGLTLAALAALLGVAAPAAAQNTAKPEVAISYSFLRDFEGHLTFPTGWILAASGRPGRNVGIVGEVSGNYKSVTAFGITASARIHSFAGGVRFLDGANHAVTPFAQVLVGTGRGSASAAGISMSAYAFMLQPGAGFDVRLHPNVLARTQVDFRMLHSDGEWGNEARVGFGLVIRFGAQ